jgi:hypothetical protein
LEKNDIVKFGRVRLRVRDIDYAEPEDELIVNGITLNNMNPSINNATLRRVT